MLSADEFIELLQRMRYKLNQLEIKKEELTEDEFRKHLTNLVDHKVNKLSKELFGHNATFHDLRAIYGNFSYELYCRRGSLNSWLTKVLGHSERTLTASLSYCTVKIVKTIPEQKENIEQAFAALQSKVKVLEGKLAAIRWDISNFDITLTNRSGVEVIYKKQKKKRDGRQLERLLEHVDQLDKDDVPITWHTLRKLGYGGATIQKLLK
jgi:hypothetical protein